MKVYYTNNEGVEVSEVMTTSTWEKTLTNAPVSKVYQLKVTYVRNNKPLDQENYKIGNGLLFSFSTTSGSGRSKGSSGAATISKSKIEEYLKEFVEEEGSITVTE